MGLESLYSSKEEYDDSEIYHYYGNLLHASKTKKLGEIGIYIGESLNGLPEIWHRADDKQGVVQAGLSFKIINFNLEYCRLVTLNIK
jgi:hypothetical protein